MCARRRLTSSCQSSIGHLCEAPQGAKQFVPLLAERGKFFLARRGEAINAPAAAGAIGFPDPANPARLLHALTQGERHCHREGKLAGSWPFIAAAVFLSVK